MQRVLTPAVVLLVSVASAQAADMYRLPYEPDSELRSSYDWSGSYAGVHGGYGWGKSAGAASGGGTGGLGVVGGGGLLEGLLGGGGLLGGFDAGILSDLIDGILGEADLGGLGDLLDDLLGGGGLPGELDSIDELLGGIETELSALDLDLGLRGSGLDEFEGMLGGIQVGHNWQSGAIVAGIEADVALSDMKESKSFSGSDTFTGIDVGGLIEISGSVAVEGEVENELSWLSTLRGRIGVAQDRFLIYGTGGVAFGDMKVAASVTTSVEAEVNVIGEGIETVAETATTTGSAEEIMIGYTVGAGVEFAVNDRWTARLEYAYVNLGDLEVNFDDGSSSDVEVDMHLVKAGANYRF
jgi:outer membrane immunogenic protein